MGRAVTEACTLSRAGCSRRISIAKLPIVHTVVGISGMIVIGPSAHSYCKSGRQTWIIDWACSGELEAHSSGTMEHLLAW